MESDRRNELHGGCSLWNLWLRLCQNWNLCFEKVFYKLGYAMAVKPWAPCLAVLLLTASFSWGFTLLELESRSEKLFLPQDSQAFNDLEVASEYFQIQLRVSHFLIKKANGENVLTRDAFLTGLRIHNEVMSKTVFEDSCVRRTELMTNSTVENCVMVTPAELFDYNKTKMYDIPEKLTKIYTDPNKFTRGGQLARDNFNKLFGKNLITSSNNTVISSEVLNFAYYSTFYLDEAGHEKNKKWEQAFTRIMKENEGSVNQAGYQLYYFTPWAIDESTSNSTMADTQFVSISFTLIFTLTTVFFTKPWNPIYSHGLLSLAGIGLIGLSLGVAIGFCVIIGVTFVGIVGVIPFVVIGVAIDDIFVILDTLDRTDVSLPIPERIAKAMSHCGATITMTTLTDLVAFALSTTSRFPAIRYFCVYGLAALLVSYIFIITCFVGLISYDLKRIKNGRFDFLFCLKSKSKKEPTDKKENIPISRKMMHTFGTYLMKTPTKLIVITLSLALLAGGIYNTTKLSQKFDLRMLGEDGSYYIKFLNQLETVLDYTKTIHVITTSEIDYSSQIVHNALSKVSHMMDDNNLYIKNRSISWIDEFLIWTERNSIKANGDGFLDAFNLFINQSNHKIYLQDLVLTQTQPKQILASRIRLFLRGDLNSVEEQEAMKDVRQKVDTILPFKSYPISYHFIFFEQYAITLEQTLQSLAICCGVIAVITALYVIHPTIVAVLIFSFVGLIVELFGMMALWDVNLNSISMICLIMSVGFAVDYSAHIAHAYAISDKGTPEERVIDALEHIGSSVLMGGVSTACGIASLGLATSEVFRIFFKMFFGIVVLGLFNGLVFNPVYLSILCRSRLIKNKNSYDINTNQIRTSELKVQKPSNQPSIGYENRAISVDAIKASSS